MRQLVQAAEGKFNPHIHVEYEWSLRLEEMDESDDDLDDKVQTNILWTGAYKEVYLWVCLMLRYDWAVSEQLLWIL